MTVSASTLVRAKSKAEAKQIATERMVRDLCHQCSRESDEEWVIDADGEPEVLEVVDG
jgi:hypothetical protein